MQSLGEEYALWIYVVNVSSRFVAINKLRIRCSGNDWQQGESLSAFAVIRALATAQQIKQMTAIS